MHQPDTDVAPSLINGIKAVRNLHYRVITETGLTTADEMLYPENLPLVDDLVSILRLVLALLKTSNTALLLLVLMFQQA
jgi:3-deoxy-7-phosphoheptulonate synthase